MALVAAGAGLLAEASDFDHFQGQASVHVSAQHYSPEGSYTFRRLQPEGVSESCEDVVAAASWGPLRVGWELVPSGGASAAVLKFVDETLMRRAAEYWASALQVRQVVRPLQAEYEGTDCWKFSFEDEYHCRSVQQPTCGVDGVKIPERYLKPKRVCGQRCSPQYQCHGDCFDGVNNRCDCDFNAWQAAGVKDYCCGVVEPQPAQTQCGTACSDGVVSIINGESSSGLVCEDDCVEHAGGEGVPDEDLHIFVTVEETESCRQRGTLAAYATYCATDQCDRSIFGTINFCPRALQDITTESKVENVVATAVHELGHILGFSNSHFPYFRAADGSPLVPRSPGAPRSFLNEVRFSCDAEQYSWNTPEGRSRFVDISPTILNVFSERGLEQCGCPVGKSDISPTCFVSTTGVAVPSCVMRMVLPNVRREARDFFDCQSLPGMEMENQPTTMCSIYSSHWEMRVFNGELMAAADDSTGFPYISRVTLALFEDSGWYQVNYSRADVLTKGVHWGYKQGCAFATQRCIGADGQPLDSRAFCTDSTRSTCSMDRQWEMKCEVGEFSSVPGVFEYKSPTSGNFLLGQHAQLDYCPTNRIRLRNRQCTDASTAVTSPYTTNFRREVFGPRSRCFDSSTLWAEVVRDGQRLLPDEGVLDEPRPVCHEVQCAADGSPSYEVLLSLNSGSLVFVLGTCTDALETLTHKDFRGSLQCVPPREVCDIFHSVLDNGERPTFRGEPDVADYASGGWPRAATWAAAPLLLLHAAVRMLGGS